MTIDQASYYSLIKRTLLVIALCVGCSILIKTIYGIRTALAVVQLKEERQVDDKIPKHVPIKYKLRKDKEHAFKDIANDNWLNDFALEVTNTSDKPIYFLELWLIFPESIEPNGGPNGIPLRFGRMAFVDFKTRPTPEDVPIRPGDTYIFAVPEKYQAGWNSHKRKARLSDPKKVVFKFIQLNFGDGTGFDTTEGVPYPYQKNRSSKIAALMLKLLGITMP